MFLTRQLSEVLKVWGTKLSGPAGQLTASLTERQTGGNSTSLISFWQKCGWEHRVPVRAHICFQSSLMMSGATNKVELSLTPGQQPQRCYQAALQVFIAGGREEHKHRFSAVIASPDHHTHSPHPWLNSLWTGGELRYFRVKVWYMKKMKVAEGRQETFGEWSL